MASDGSGPSGRGLPPRSSSSLDIRPSSRMSNRGLTPSISVPPRPPSSASRRPPSSLSTRPQSRLAPRPSSRQLKSRLIPLFQDLVTKITGFRDDDSEADLDRENFRLSVDFVAKNLDAITIMKAGASTDMKTVDRHIDGHAAKARINCQDQVGEALETAHKLLKNRLPHHGDLDADLKASHMPDHLQFLLAMSSPPTRETEFYAEEYLDRIRNPEAPPKPLTWADILAEEPFEGEHWEGVYGLPPGTVRRSAEYASSSDETGPSLSPLSDEESDEDGSLSPRSYGPKVPAQEAQPQVEQRHSRPPYNHAHRQVVEDLQSQQYWKDQWKSDVDTYRPFSLGEASTFGPTIQKALLPDELMFALDKTCSSQRYIHETDAVREALIALQGRQNILLAWSEDGYEMLESTPRLPQLSLGAQLSIISSYAQKATTLQHLRNFVSSIFSLSQEQVTKENREAIAQYPLKHRQRITRTLEAFADALHHELRLLDIWCADREQSICRARCGVSDQRLIVSLLETEKAYKDMFEQSFDALLAVIRKVLSPVTPKGQVSEDHNEHWMRALGGKPPSMITAALLNTLFEFVQERMERRDLVTSESLMRVFVRTAEPIWAMIGRWIRDGMGQGTLTGNTTSELDDEFFIENNGPDLGLKGIALLDPDFWEEGYTLREDVIGGTIGGGSKADTAVPNFLEHVAELVLEAGKAVGLLKALGIPPVIENAAMFNWCSFQALIATGNSSNPDRIAGSTPMSSFFSISVDALSRLIYDWLLPPCQACGAQLSKVLIDECSLWKHLYSIEGLYFMRRGDAVSNFTDTLFAKMDTQQQWSDFHFLNTAFTDVIEASVNAGAKDWIQPSLVRFSYRGTKDKDRAINSTVKAIDGLLIEYAVPFPLTYIFQPKTVTTYGEVFVLLLQIRRAKSVLERVLVRGNEASKRDRNMRAELKAFYAMRSRLSWFINTLLNFLTTYVCLYLVIHVQVVKFHEAFHNARSLDEIIRTHNNHIGKVLDFCLLLPHTATLHRAILSILDISLYFTTFFSTFAGHVTTTHDVTQHSMSMRRHRSRRHRLQRKNVIGFSLPSTESPSDSDSDSDDEKFDLSQEPSFSLNASVSTAPDDFVSGLDKMSSELDDLVRFVRRGIESLAGGSDEAASTFRILAFALEDWDN
ncbi:hypothetical protein BDN72DRAFT_932310 [Pluteus cervinus]|uniref:Uncharacterized protein n=1 Tax=Pluteus cervinus TaxID=181527 RepID=A0ACD3B2N8_9AGAR|nr:hypothetical protein BDN72DRAFT_932310 [Pluteus cervinus]